MTSFIQSSKVSLLTVTFFLIAFNSSSASPLFNFPGFGGGGSSSYTLSQSNRGTNFYQDNYWQFYNQSDPTHGSVQYLNAQQAQEQNLIGYTSQGQAFARASNQNIPKGTNRPSVRFQSVNAYDEALVIFDIVKMPIGAATWPALWTVFGSNWPYGGEIDVMENIGVTGEGRYANQVSVHMGNSSPNSASSSSFTGKELGTNCQTKYSEGQEGCQFLDSNKNGPSWGTAFNNNGGGVWAVQFGNNNGVKVWFWGRGNEPSELANPSTSQYTLDPSNWGTPMANFQSDVINQDLRQQNIVLDITIGGDWAGNEPLDGPYQGQTVAEALPIGSNYNDAEFIINGIDIYT